MEDTQDLFEYYYEQIKEEHDNLTEDEIIKLANLKVEKHFEDYRHEHDINLF